jgi:hypothetical protein
MLFVCTGCWKPEKDGDLWKRLAERKVPEGMNAIEYYYLLGRHKLVVIVEAPEPYLELVFGDKYRLYKLTIPRYVGLRSRDSEGEE